jgi:hypothetical protein
MAVDHKAAKVIRITDIGDPHYTPRELVALKEAEDRHVELTVDSVLSAAKARTGLGDFGPAGFRERLRLMLEEVDSHPYNTAYGRADFFDRMTEWASNRLRIQDLLKRHPEIEGIEIRRPIIIVGMPRTGGTDLQNFIAADPRLRSLPAWEARQPVPNDPERRPRSDVIDPRLSNQRHQVESEAGILPYAELLHSTNPESIEEESFLKSYDFTRWGIQWHREMPRWRDYYDSHDQTQNYAYLKTALKILQWYRPGERWILRACEHMGQVRPLIHNFPDATIVFTHRDPVAVIQSSATMAGYWARMHYTKLDPARYLDYYKEMVHRLLKAYIRDRDLVPREQVVDTFFDRTIANQMVVLEQIYETAGFPLTDEVRQTIEFGRAQRARGFVPWEKGKVVVDLRADYGADPVSIRREFDYYFDAAPVRPQIS